MAEVFGAGEEPQAEASPAVQTDNAAVAIALDRARRRRGKAAANDEVDRFLEKQEGLIDKQARHLDEQLHQMRLKHFSERLKVALQLLAVGAGMLAFAVVAWMAISAASADGLSIKPFSTPPALVQRGVTGETIASRVMDRLSQMAEQSRTSERQKTVDADWGQHISIEIPETGVSLSQLDQWLREKLGRQRRITGEANYNPDGTLELDARIGAHALPAQTGTEADLNAMIGKLAEAIYAREQPTTYYLYLVKQGRWADAFELGKARAASADPGEQSSGLVDMAQSVQHEKGDLAALPYYERAWATAHPNPAVASQLSSLEFERGHWEQVVKYDRQWPQMIKRWDRYSAQARDNFLVNSREELALDFNDYAQALVLAKQRDFQLGNSSNQGRYDVAEITADLHQTGEAARLCVPSDEPDPGDLFQKGGCDASVAAKAEDWAGVVAQTEALRAAMRQSLHSYVDQFLLLDPGEALALAHLGRFAEAHALVDDKAADNVAALLARAVLADAENKPAEADRWYAEAVRLTPSLPEPLYWWGKARLERGQAREAQGLFDRALKLGPRYPDALEGRGEAALAMGDAEGAVKSFAAADKPAPKWGRLHLKWGEALAKAGKAEEARAQLKAAAGLDLTADERAELAGLKR